MMKAEEAERKARESEGVTREDSKKEEEGATREDSKKEEEESGEKTQADKAVRLSM